MSIQPLKIYTEKNGRVFCKVCKCFVSDTDVVFHLESYHPKYFDYLKRRHPKYFRSLLLKEDEATPTLCGHCGCFVLDWFSHCQKYHPELFENNFWSNKNRE